MAEPLRGILVLFLCCGSVSSREEPFFALDKEAVPPEEDATLSWKWSMATVGYLSVVGMLQNPRSGSTRVNPRQTTDYVLVLEAPGLPPRVLSRWLIVRRAKGSASEWPEGLFASLPYFNDYESRGTSLARLADRTKSILQEFGEVRQWSQDQGTVVLATAFSERTDLGKPDENPKRVWRVAYRVELSNLGEKIRLRISAAIEWRVVIDRHWYPENASSSNIYQGHVKAIKQKILGE